MEHTELRGTFATGAAEYDRLRPSYPQAALDLLDGGPRLGRDRGEEGRTLDVVDIGAGTGKLSVQLVERGHRVVAVEPSAAMRDQLASVPGIQVVAASGEDTGLASARADLVTYGQAWHWIDPVRGGREAARLLRPGGTVAMLWNMVDNTVPWVARWEEAAHSTTRAWRPVPKGAVHAEPLPPEAGPYEEQVDLVSWTLQITLADLEHHVRTRSYYLEAGPDEQEHLRHAVAQVLAEDFAGRPSQCLVELPYVTTVRRYRLVSAR